MTTKLDIKRDGGLLRSAVATLDDGTDDLPLFLQARAVSGADLPVSRHDDRLGAAVARMRELTSPLDDVRQGTPRHGV